MAATGVKISHHQLFFDRMAPRTGTAPRRPRRVLPLGAAWVQPELPGAAGPPRAGAPPASPSLAAAIRIADCLAEARGWSGEIRRRVRQGLAAALDGYREGQDVAWSRALPALRAPHLYAGHVAEALRQAGLLHDDRRPAFDAWLDRKLDGVTAGIRRDAERWLRTLKDGGPAAAPAASPPSTATWGRPCPRCWTGRHAITTSARSPATTCRTTCAACTGPAGAGTLVTLRSLFGSCLSASVIFRNPARGIKVGRRPSVTVLQPLGQDDIDNAVAAAATR